MKRFLAFLLLVSLIPLAASAAPTRIVSLAPSITKSLYLLGAEEQVAGVTIYCPPEAAAKEKIGTILEPNIEAIVALTPDLVIATKEGNSPATVQKLKKLGLQVYVMDSVNSFSDICNGFIDLGSIVGKEEKAQAIVADARHRIETVRSKARSLAPVPVFWEVGAQPLFTVSKNSFVNDFMEFAGGKNIFKETRARYPQISSEEVVRRDPDVIILVDMGDVTSSEKKLWEKFKTLKAVRAGRVHVLNDTRFTDPTPAAIADGVEKLFDILHRSHE